MTRETGPVWELTSLRKEYAASWPFGRKLVALEGASLSVRRGERVGIIGVSGSGKTTLVRCGLGLVPRDSGSIALFGEDTSRWSASRWRAARGRVQILFQDSRAMLHPDLPIGALLEESAALHRPSEDPQAAAVRALESVSLAHRRSALPRELSGGERRRAGIARVLLARPELLVVDEPTSGLDAVLKIRMLDLLLASVDPGCAIVLVTHDLGAVVPVTDRIVVLHEGRVIESLQSSLVASGISPTERCTAELLEASGFGPKDMGGRAGPFGGSP